MRIKGSAITLRGPKRPLILCDDDECCERPSLVTHLAGAFGAVLAARGAEALWDRLFPKPPESSDDEEMTVEGLMTAVREAVADGARAASDRLDAIEERLDELEAAPSKPARKR